MATATAVDRGSLIGSLRRAATSSATAITARARRLARSALAVAGLGLIDVGLWDLHHVAGFIGAGASLLLLEWRTDRT